MLPEIHGHTPWNRIERALFVAKSHPETGARFRKKVKMADKIATLTRRKVIFSRNDRQMRQTISNF